MREGAGVPDSPAASLVLAAAAGNQRAWDELVERFAGLVWAIARAHRLGPADAADVSQTTWLRLVEHLHRLRDPEHVGGWLATTARHECLRVIRRANREVPDDMLDTDFNDEAGSEPSPEAVVLTNERRSLLLAALGRLTRRCQILLRALAASPQPSYAEVSAALDIPVGSIGPTRARCLEHLRRELDAQHAVPDAGEY
jgi:RNA polymerase sigma factor (sigma-70 family)